MVYWWRRKGTKKAFIIPVPNRNAQTQTIGQIIQDHILPGTIIVTDQWRAYSTALNGNDLYIHRQVNHSYNFVDPDDPMVHTQTIDGLWGHMKKFLSEKPGISKEQQSEYFIQFIWEYKIEKRNRFNVLLSSLK